MIKRTTLPILFSFLCLLAFALFSNAPAQELEQKLEDVPEINYYIPPLRPANPRTVVLNWLSKHLYNRETYEPLDWSEPVFMAYGGYFNWSIRHVYSFDHPQMGVVTCDEIFYFDPDGELAGRTYTSHIWVNQRYYAPDWGRGWEKMGPPGLLLEKQAIDRMDDLIPFDK